MADFTIETTYRLPVFRQVSYAADTPEAACRLAIADTDWSGQREDYESSGETYVTGICDGAEAAYRGPAIPVPPHFGEAVQRQAAHFELMLGLLKIMVSDAKARRTTAPEWFAKSEWAIALGEAILDGARGPDRPADLPRSRHVLAELQEDRVRDGIPEILASDERFAGLTPDSVTDADIHAACLAVAASINLSEEIGAAEFSAALIALRRASGGGA
ncbi:MULTISPECIES: hypothetical protein [unclassified Devosia]|uniref:hypothetical protein n=1 Tax=unclassified Devosia TaxID=196773 RepID=UPI00086A7F03|nr:MULTISPECIES: hypothetical protein [unclassified Devosia]MBN9362822.1 hypothetical protein [Devosia sp.]ODS88376.1 MAG: hypothetical protein ABS47_09630 [Devosia sp. SCN 66-27]OJX23993.1 MAG: hypothetical protein BGO83_03870 [Devosia sp. 66-14]